MRIAIHQPEYFPWLGFLDKARRVDVLVLLDSVQFDRSSLQHRTRIMGSGGTVWLTIPFVHKFPQRIDELAFVDDRWASKHMKSVQSCYGRAAGWKAVAPRLESFFTGSYPRVVGAAIASVDLLLDAFRARPPRVVRSSALEVTGAKGDLVLEICRDLGATSYLAGRTGATYLDAPTFQAAGVAIEVQQFAIPNYPRQRPLTPEEAGGLSALDALAHLGDQAADLLLGGQPT
jgi:hypothetical protein